MPDMTFAYWRRHPGRNPAHRFGEGRDRWQEVMPLPGRPFNKVTVLGPKNPSRWLPHTGQRERTRHRPKFMTDIAAE